MVHVGGAGLLANSERKILARRARQAGDLDQLISIVNNLRTNDSLYLKVRRRHSGAVVQSEILPALPPSVFSTIRSGRGMVLTSLALSLRTPLERTLASVVRLAATEDFEGQPAYRVRVTYGTDEPLWEYFFDTKSYQLLGCRFSSGERKDGELIVYEGEVEERGIRLPKKRSWYKHSDGELIGVDDITRYSRRDVE